MTTTQMYDLPNIEIENFMRLRDNVFGIVVEETQPELETPHQVTDTNVQKAAL